MRNGFALMLIVLLSGGQLRGGAINYMQIPSDTTSYFHLDVERLGSSSFVRSISPPNFDLAAQEEAILGGRLGSITAYLSGPTPKITLLVRGDAGVMKKAEESFAGSKDTVAITYDDQKVYYASRNPWLMSQSAGPSTQPLDEKAREKSSGSMFTLGFAIGNDESKFPFGDSPVYAAFLKDNLIVAANDLKTMTLALDVIKAKKPSLATDDPNGMKSPAIPGVIFQGVGLAAQFKLDKATTQPSAEKTGPMGLDLFGSFKGKALVGRVYFGEDDKFLFANATLAMIDSATAEQLKNLSIGMKALVSLSNMAEKRLIEPVEVQVNGKDLLLNWKWPLSNITDLLHLQDAPPEPAKPPTAPANLSTPGVANPN